MSAGPRQPDDNAAFSWCVVAIGLCIAGYFGWTQYHAQIVAAVLAVQHWHAWLIGNRALDSQLLALDPDRVSASHLVDVSRMVGQTIQIPAVVIVALLGVVCLFRAAPSRFCRNLNLDRLIRAQAEVFRTISAHIGRRLGSDGIAAGEPRATDPSLHDREWIERFATGPAGFDEGAARRELARQLGPRWTGYAKAEPHVRCLFAAFALHASRDRSGAIDLLGTLAESLSSGEPPLVFPERAVAAAGAAMRDPKITERCDEIAAKHAYTMPALMTVLSHARRRAGVLAPAQFNFLKLVDRRLWYSLHSLGFPDENSPDFGPMPNPLIEAAGARCHWHAEVIAGRPISIPQIDAAAATVRASAEETAQEDEEEP